MMKKIVRVTAAEMEAGEWFVRLSKPTVSLSDLEAFKAWRVDPVRRAAYDAVEASWASASALEADPDIRATLAAIPRTGPRVNRVWSSLFGGGVLVACTAAAAWLVLAPASYSAPEFNPRTVKLDDGTSVRLDAGARISVRLDDRSRKLTLVRGRALFDVAPDPSRRFVVQAGGTQVVALGTRFVVSRKKNDASVALIHGKVEVRRPAQGAAASWILAPGQGVTMAGRAIEPIDPERVLDWTDGRLVFRATPLDEAAEEMNRYARRPVRVQAGILSKSPISGAFDAGQEEAFARAAAEALSLELTNDADGGLVLKAARQPDRLLHERAGS